MSVLQPQPAIITLKEYEALPGDIRAEVFDGQIYYMGSPSQIHQSILLEVSTLLNSYVKSQKGGEKLFTVFLGINLWTYFYPLCLPFLRHLPDIRHRKQNRVQYKSNNQSAYSLD